MIINELSRLWMIIKVVEKKLKYSEAVDIMNVGIRQIKRLVKKHRFEGAAGLISKKKRGPREPQSTKRTKIASYRPGRGSVW